MNLNTKLQHDGGSLHEIIGRLTKARRIGEGRYVACCPVHQDRTPSLAVTQKTDGIILVHCFGCNAGGVDICNALGIDPSTLFPPTDNPKYEKQSRGGFFSVANVSCLAWRFDPAISGCERSEKAECAV
ncbi:CHC2 zinc finger [Nitrosomonas oligotropha]|uniref:CHC2 zinc finger n=1 Tax=Nitrosomonas oligotropha TaxID=42354 RepID=A0A1H8SVR0_9PROT|nr:CHC2 zinc finger [Nitrosomonas oligotropha]SEO82625.1 CHC2 zinc finger [Nitrosomonas oligotropha]